MVTLTISTPCPKRWKDLVGDDRVRYCGDCKLNVYNLTVMRPAEIEALARRTPGRLCGQLYVRPDRTATLRDCPSGRAGVLRRRIAKLAFALLGLMAVLAFRSLDRPDTSDLPPWLRAVANWIEPEKPRPVPKPSAGMVMGRLCPVAPPPSTPTGSGPTSAP